MAEQPSKVPSPLSVAEVKKLNRAVSYSQGNFTETDWRSVIVGGVSALCILALIIVIIMRITS